jgi:hypothetical protein
VRREAFDENSDMKAQALLRMYGGALSEYKRKLDIGEKPQVILEIWFKNLKNSSNFLAGLPAYYIHYTSFYMDAYLLYHLLHNNPNKNNVIYAGEAHIEHCQKFLEYYGYELKFRITSPNGEYDQCIPINDKTLPLFS